MPRAKTSSKAPASPDAREEALWLALRAKDRRAVKAALAKKPDLDKPLGSCGGSAAWAVECRFLPGLMLVLAAGADPNIPGAAGSNALMLAIGADSDERDEMASALLEFKADPNAKTADGETALILAARKRRDVCARMLLHAGANPQASTPGTGSTALMWASYFNNHAMLADLISAGAHPDAPAKDGRSACEWAVSGNNQGRLGQTMAILEGASVKIAIDGAIGPEEPSEAPRRSARL